MTVELFIYLHEWKHGHRKGAGGFCPYLPATPPPPGFSLDFEIKKKKYFF